MYADFFHGLGRKRKSLFSRLKNTEKSLIRQPPVADYQRVINSYVDKGYLVPSSLPSMTSQEINDTLRKFWKIDTLDIQENAVQAW